MGVLVRTAALIAIRSYVDAGGSDAILNRLIVDKPDGTFEVHYLDGAGRLVLPAGLGTVSPARLANKTLGVISLCPTEQGSP